LFKAIIKNQTIKDDNKSFKEIYNTLNTNSNNAIGNRLLKSEDINFVERELANIKRKDKNLKDRKYKIWEQPLRKEEEIDINIRNKISELRKKSKENFGFSEVDLKSQKFLNRIDMTSILDSRKFIEEKNKPKDSQKKQVDSIFNFVVDNREISLKNFLLDLLKEERSLIDSKELLVSKSLKESEIKLDKDYKAFIEFVEDDKKVKRLNEQKIIEFQNKNRDLETVKKKLIQENKSVMDDLDRTVKSINNLKSNAAFVHLVLGGKEKI
jgi:hypothetical protein